MASASTTVTVRIADLPAVQRLVRAAVDVFDDSIDVDRMREQHAEGSPVMLVYEVDRVTLLELYDALMALRKNVKAGPCDHRFDKFGRCTCGAQQCGAAITQKRGGGPCAQPRPCRAHGTEVTR